MISDAEYEAKIARRTYITYLASSHVPNVARPAPAHRSFSEGGSYFTKHVAHNI